MEAMRARMMADSDQFIPLGKSKGIVQENLGQTSFKKASQSTPRKRAGSTSDSGSSDEIDLLSNATPPASSIRSSQGQVKAKPTLKLSPKRSEPKSKPKPKPRMVQSKSKPKTSARSKQASASSLLKEVDSVLEMPPSNQLASNSQDFDEITSSPLDELSQNTVAKPKKMKGKRKAEPEAFPMDVEGLKSSLGLETPTENNPTPFSPSPPKKAKISRKPRKPAPAPFPMDIPEKRKPAAECSSLRSPRSSFDKLQPFPVNPSDIIRNISTEEPPIFMRTGYIKPMEYSDESNVDPSKICPYCDEPFPENPSPTLQDLVNRVKRKSYRDPRPGNPHGLMAPLILFAEVCERHRLEMNYLPLAISRGWPTNISFITIPERVQNFKPSLDAIIADPQTSSFWRELRNDIALIGRKKLASVTGLYATFEKSQPGYYGEQGSIIIQQTLYSLFPLGSISEEALEPLSVEQFLSQVLLPEAAVLLIMEDMKLTSKEKALETLEESKKYGIAMFPERAQDDDVEEIGERLARERALSRRKYLEEIGETDDDIIREIETEKQIKSSQRKDKVNTTSETDTDSGSRQRSRKVARSVPKTPHPAPKPKSRPKSPEYVRVDLLSDNETPRPSIKTKKPAARSTFKKSKPELLSSDDNSDVRWTYNLRDDERIPKRKARVPKGEASTLDATPKPKSRTNLKPQIRGSASEVSDVEVVSKPGPRPKPKPIKRPSKSEDILGGGKLVLPRSDEDYDWLMSSGQD